MNNDEKLKLLRDGENGIAKWNALRSKGDIGPHFYHFDLSGADLREAQFRGMTLADGNFSGANLTGACFANADLGGVRFMDADLSDADMTRTKMSSVWEESHLMAHTSSANFSGAKLRRADFFGADLSNCYLHDADVSESEVRYTTFGNLDLSRTRGLDSVIHYGPSTIGIDTIVNSRGRIPEVFLRGVGLSPLEVAIASLYNPELSDNDISDLVTTKIAAIRMCGPLYIGGVFISYSHLDAAFADKLCRHLGDEGASVWRDVHNLTAGQIHKQIDRAMRVQDIVVVILSKNSLASDWVWQEIEWARRKEKSENRDVLCPIALDDAWKTVEAEPVLMRQLRRYNILDFGAWKTKRFTSAFQKLADGLKLNYSGRMEL